MINSLDKLRFCKQIEAAFPADEVNAVEVWTIIMTVMILLWRISTGATGQPMNELQTHVAIQSMWTRLSAKERNGLIAGVMSTLYPSYVPDVVVPKFLKEIIYEVFGNYCREMETKEVN